MLPEKSDLKAQVTGILRKQGYRIEKVIYESIPNHHVTASLYIPDGKGPFPGVLLFCGHEPEAKATVSYQQTAILFALHGFVVLVVDPISQGERYQLTDKGVALTRGGTTEHTLINAAANLVGTGTVAFELWDNIRSLDYLITRKEVDNERIGCLGNSGGGTQVSYFVGMDDRIKVAAPCSYVASRERNFDLIGANDGCQHIVGEGSSELEISDFLIMFAPKPLLILAGRYDFVDYTGTQIAHRELKDVYRALKQEDKIEMFTADDGHGISKPKREAAVMWFKKWLYNNGEGVVENTADATSEKELTASLTGQVSSSFQDEVDDMDRIVRLAASYRTKRNDPIDIRDKIKTVLKIPFDRSPVMSETTGRIQQTEFSLDKVVLRRKDALPVPLLTILPDKRIQKIILWLHDGGKHRIADSTKLVQHYRDDGALVVIADLAGFGELSDPLPLNDSKYSNKEYRNAVAALHIGSSLPAERVKNIGTIMDFIYNNDEWRNIPVRVCASGDAVVPVLHAAVLDSRIGEVQIFNAINSFEDILKNPLKKDWYSVVIPGVLKYYDIPDLKKALDSKLISE